MCVTRSQQEMSEAYATDFYTDGKGVVITDHADTDGSWYLCKSPDCRVGNGWTYSPEVHASWLEGLIKHASLEDAKVAAEAERSVVTHV